MKNETKKKYKTPKLQKYGSVKQFTQTLTGTHGMDLGMSPASRTATCLTQTTEIEEHRLLLMDTTCQEKFKQAIFETVRPGDVVLDLGTGTGIHAFFACQAGAKRVYAVDAEGIIERAKRAAADNGFADRINFIYGLSDEIELPEKVDVIITNIGYWGILKYFANARKKFLKKDGRLVPGSMYNSFVPAEISDVYNAKIEFWKKAHHGFDFRAFHEVALHHPIYKDFSTDSFLAQPINMPPLDLRTHALDKFSWNREFLIKKTGRIDCILGWYTFMLTKKIALSTEPPLRLAPGLWVQHMLPLEERLPVKAGDRISVEVSMHKAPSISDPIWSWSVSKGSKIFRQSTFKAMAFIPNPVE